MKPAASSRPCIESAASCSAAIQPSVRSPSAATSGAVSVEAHHVVEVRRRLVGREAQVGRAELDELAARAQPRQRQRRDRRGWRSPGAAAAAGGRAGRPSPRCTSSDVDDVVVVEHQHDVDVVLAPRSLSSEVSTSRIGAGGPRAAAGRPASTPRPGTAVPQRGDHVGPEARRVAVVAVQRQPRRRAPWSARRASHSASRWSCRSRPARRRAPAWRRSRRPGARAAGCRATRWPRGLGR